MIQLIQGDCLEVMKKGPDKSVDMILTDPPYGTTACKWDSVIPLEPMWKELKRLIKDNGAIVMTASQPFTSALIVSNIKMFRYEIIWHKNLSGGFVNAKKMIMKYHENILIFSKKQPTYNPQFEEYSESVKKRFKNNNLKINSKKQIENKSKNSIAGVIKTEHSIDYERGKYPQSVQFFKSVHTANSNRLHPTQKPVALMEYLIKTYTNEGETVLDFTMGSGTTGVACKNLNRNFIGIELDKKYFEIAKERIDKA